MQSHCQWHVLRREKSDLQTILVKHAWQDEYCFIVTILHASNQSNSSTIPKQSLVEEYPAGEAWCLDRDARSAIPEMNLLLALS